MKIKNKAYLRSLTALLRQNFKNSSESNEKIWYAAVPSITYIWTHKPQWRRRHKNSKKSKSYRFPVSSITSRIDESDLWDSLKPLESRPCSRSSTSPYETCSSRPIVTESVLTRINDAQQTCEVFSFFSNQRNLLFDRKPSLYETRSDSGLRRAKGSQFMRLIRSQKRLAIRSSANSQNTVGTFSSLEVNKSMQLSIGRDLFSDCSIPKRRVTFSNYVSENSVTDTKSQISETMNDDDQDEVCWWRRSNDRLTDDGDNFSLQSNLSCLFSSMIFDDSKSSFFSLTTSPNSESSRKSDTSLKKECSESIFYVNASYSNGSSCNLVSFPKICPNYDYSEHSEILTENNNVRKKIDESRVDRSNERELKEVDSEIKIVQEINSGATNQCSIECITVELKEISSTVKEVSIGSTNDSDKKKHYESFCKNHISTDTNGLSIINVVPLLFPVTDFSKNDVDNAKLNVDEIFGLFQQPKAQIDAAFLLKQLSKVGAQTFGNYFSDNEIDNIRRIQESVVRTNPCKNEDNVDWLRIDTERFGEFESVLIEMKDLDASGKQHEILKRASSSEIYNSLQEPCESLVVNLVGISKHSGLVASSMSKFHKEFENCSTINKCCMICGRKNTDNPRYLRPVCQVKGVIPTSRLENDPWINVIKKVSKHESGKQMATQENTIAKKLSSRNDQHVEETSIDSNSNNPRYSSNELLPLVRKVSDATVEKIEDLRSRSNKKDIEEDCFSITITDVENSLPPISTVETNILPSKDQSTSCPPEPELCSSTSFGFATIRGPRAQSAKTYFMRESVRTTSGTANRLLCVISESDTLMGVPPFLSKKPPDWFGRQMPTRKWSRR